MHGMAAPGQFVGSLWLDSERAPQADCGTGRQRPCWRRNVFQLRVRPRSGGFFEACIDACHVKPKSQNLLSLAASRRETQSRQCTPRTHSMQLPSFSSRSDIKGGQEIKVAVREVLVGQRVLLRADYERG